jgi:hypothetical protein
MPSIKRIAATVGGGLAVCAGLLATQTAGAQAEPLHSAAPAAAHTSAAQPASAANNCGFQYGGLDGQSWYNNCSPYSVEIRISYWFSPDSYACVAANSTDVLNAYDTLSPTYAVFDGRKYC